jgi:hypothetical protein
MQPSDANGRGETAELTVPWREVLKSMLSNKVVDGKATEQLIFFSPDAS